MLSAEQTRVAVELLDERFGLDALYVFGSHAAGRERPDSDVDLAALTRRLPGKMDRLEAREELSSRLRRSVDLVVLSDASPVIARQVLAHGKLLYEGDGSRHAEFVAHALSRYADLKRIRAPVEAALVQRLRDAG